MKTNGQHPGKIIAKEATRIVNLCENERGMVKAFTIGSLNGIKKAISVIEKAIENDDIEKAKIYLEAINIASGMLRDKLSEI